MSYLSLNFFDFSLPFLLNSLLDRVNHPLFSIHSIFPCYGFELLGIFILNRNNNHLADSFVFNLFPGHVLRIFIG